MEHTHTLTLTHTALTQHSHKNTHTLPSWASYSLFQQNKEHPKHFYPFLFQTDTVLVDIDTGDGVYLVLLFILYMVGKLCSILAGG